MNILEAEDMVKGLPDQVLFQYAQNPPPQIPQYLAVSEVQRRQDMRQRFQAQSQGQQPTVMDQILQGGSPEQAPPGGPPGGAPPDAAPPGAPMEQPMTGAPMAQMYGGGRVPGMSYMQGGGSINAGEQAEVIREANSGKARMADVLRRNLTTPEGIGRLAAGALGTAVAGPLAGYAASSGFERLFPMRQSSLQSAAQRSVQASNPFNMYGQSLAQAGAANQSQMDQAAAMGFGDARQAYLDRISSPLRGGVVRDERLGDASLNAGSGMANGGLTPGGIVYMQEGRTVPGVFSLQHQLPGLYNESGELKPAAAAVRDFLAPRRAQFSVIREAEALRSQGRLDEAVALLRSEGIDPSRVLGERPAAPPAAPAAPAAAPAAAPGPVDFMAEQSGQPPMNFSLPANFGMPSAASVSQPQAAPQAAPPAPPAPNVAPGGIGDLAPRQPRAGGMSVTGMASELFKPQEVSEQEQALINLINQQREQGVPEPLNLEPYRQAALQRQQEARDEARRMAIANTLMGLGTGLVAGDPAAGLQRATQMATETLREGRKEAQAEGRSAEALQLQAAQQARQAQIEKMQFDRESLGTVANIYKDLNKSNKESRERALQIFATYDSSLQSNLSRMQEQGALDRRSILSAITAAEDRIEDALEAQVGMTAEDKDKIRTTMRERAIRQVGSLFPNLDVEGMIGGGGSQGATANRFSVREVKPGQ